MSLCEKYRANCFADIKGQEPAIEKIKTFFQEFPKKKALILHGPPGTGKTSLAHALANEKNLEILELNASDFRNKEQLEKILAPAASQKSLFAKGKIILVDEVDGISSLERGGLPELLDIISNTSFPIIITANDIWDRKFNELRRKCELVQLKEVNYNIILEILKEISVKEQLDIDETTLKSISAKSRGDLRAAINDLQSIRNAASPESISERDKQADIFNIMKQIFKSKPTNETIRVYDSTDMNLDEIVLWIEENIPNEYQGKELYKAFEALSRADVFRGRIYRQQHWRFLVYQNIMLSAGVSAAKDNVKIGFTSYKKPSRILKIWMANQKNMRKKSIASKYAKFCHISKKRALKDFFLIKRIINSDIAQKIKLSEEEVAFLQEKSM